MKLQVFALEADHELGRSIAARLGIELSAHEEREFEDGEHKTRPLGSVRGNDVFVLESLYGDGRRSVNDKLARLLFFLGAVRDAGAGRITAVVPYLAYSRKERKTKARDPVTTRYMAALFEAVGIDGILVMDVHSLAAYQNAFRCRAEHLEAGPLFARHLSSLGSGTERELVVLSPDAGGIKRAELFRQLMERALGACIENAFMEKRRSGGVVEGETLVGAVAGRTVLIIDDLISTGTTLVRAARACRTLGASKVIAAATHGLFVGDANRTLSDPALDEILVTNTVPPFRLEPGLRAKVTVLDVAEPFTRAITAIHEGRALAELDLE
jgi:ribose-phosphate pyrophosphokinase